jgi:hypothetical protein
MVLYNRRFVEMWGIPEEIMATRDDDKAIAFALDRLMYPERFVEKVKELYSKPGEESIDTLQFKDGRVFERYSRPQKLREEVLGRVWNFRDVTQRVQSEQALKEKMDELERMNKLMVGRELKMVELKEELKKLKGANS